MLYCTDASYAGTLSFLQWLSTLAQSQFFDSCSCVSPYIVPSTSILLHLLTAAQHQCFNSCTQTCVLRLRTIEVIVNSRVSQGRRFQSKGSKIRVQESFVYLETKTSYRTRLFYSCLYTKGKHGQSMEDIWYVYVNNAE